MPVLTPHIFTNTMTWFGPVVRIRSGGYIDQRSPDDGNDPLDDPLQLGFGEDIFPLLSCGQ